MISLENICCLCLKSDIVLMKLRSNIDRNSTYYWKLLTLIPEMALTELYEQGMVCYSCCTQLITMIVFRETCLRIKEFIEEYVKKPADVEKTIIFDDISKNFKQWEEKRKNKQFLERNNTEVQAVEKDTVPETADNNLPLAENIKDDNMSNDDDNMDIKVEFDSSDENEENCDIAQQDTDNSVFELLDHDYISTRFEPLHENSIQNIINYIDDISILQCKPCQREFNDEYELEAHKILHETQQWYITVQSDCGEDFNKCLLCDMIFKDQEEFLKHKTMHSDATSLNSEGSGKNKKAKSNNAEYNKSRRYFCVCGKDCKDYETYKAHKKIHKKKGPLKCNICPRRFTLIKAFKNHIKQHEKDETECIEESETQKQTEENGNQKVKYRCFFCARSFIQYMNLLMHINWHNGLPKNKPDESDIERPYQCDKCVKRFKTYRTYKTHYVLHTRDSINICQKCGKMLASKSLLKEHQLLHNEVKKIKTFENPINRKSYLCDHCGHTFFTLGGIRRHKQKLNVVKSNKCDYCDRRFLDKRNLAIHLLEHTDGKTFRCEDCDKTFLSVTKLKGHRYRAHPTEKKMYKCTTCLKIFRTSVSLLEHEKTHSSNEVIKKYIHECKKCQHTFLTRRNLYLHSLTHTERYKATCEFCNKTGFVNSIKMHRRIHTGERPYQCTICGTSFTRPHILKIHMKIHSNVAT